MTECCLWASKCLPSTWTRSGCGTSPPTAKCQTFGKVRAPPCATQWWWVDRAERGDRAHFLISLQRRFPHHPDLDTRRDRGTALFPVHTAIQCIIHERNFSNLSTGYGSRFEEWADRSPQSGGNRRGRPRWVLAAADGCRRRGEVFEDQIASRSSGDACKLSAVCSSAFTSCPVLFGRRG